MTAKVWGFVLFAVVLAAHPHGNMGCADSRWSIPTAVSLLREGNLDLDEYLPLLRSRGFYFTEQVRGHYYTVYPFGTSILAAPAVAVMRPALRAAFRAWPALRTRLEAAQWARGCPPAEGEPVVRLHSWVEQIIATLVIATCTVVLFAVARCDLPTGAAACVALLFAFATPAWSTASRSLWQHGPLMLMLSIALLVQRRRSPMFILGVVLAFAYVVRPTAGVPLALGSLWVVFERRRQWLAYAAGAAIVLVPFVLNNRAIYGTWLAPYYHPGFYSGTTVVSDALEGLLVSPGRGLLVYSPIFLFVPIGIVLKWRSEVRGKPGVAAGRLLDVVLIASIVAHTIATAWVNAAWWGGYSYGPRLLSDNVPYLVYFLVPVVGWLFTAPRTPAWRVAATLFAAAVLVSVAMHAQGAINPAATNWNVNPDDINQNQIRLWDWRRPPFLAGWQREAEPPNLDAACTAPPAPPSEFAVVSNAHHTLVMSWRPATAQPTEYIVESGTATGLSNFPDRSVRTGAATLTIYPVPPGVYYGRVRAKNGCGVSSPSNEVKVEVR